MKKWIGRIVKIAFVLFAFMAIILTVMVNMGGNNDNLKTAIEDYIASSSGYVTDIRTLNNMSFYPSINIDIEGIEMRRGEEREIAINTESAKLSFGFWDLFLGRRRLKDLTVKNMSISRGEILDNPIVIESLQIDETVEGQAFLSLTGAIGDAPLKADITMETYGRAGNYRYGLGKESTVTAALGALDLKALTRARSLGGFHLPEFSASFNGEEIIKGALTISRDDDDLNMKGDVSLPKDNTQAEIDLDSKHVEQGRMIDGEIDALTFSAAAFAKNAPLTKAHEYWRGIFANKNRAGEPLSVDIELEADLFKTESGADIRDYEGTITLENNALIFTQDPQEP